MILTKEADPPTAGGVEEDEARDLWFNQESSFVTSMA